MEAGSLWRPPAIDGYVQRNETCVLQMSYVHVLFDSDFRSERELYWSLIYIFSYDVKCIHFRRVLTKARG
jgi:hypothetical protein